MTRIERIRSNHTTSLPGAAVTHASTVGTDSSAAGGAATIERGRDRDALFERTKETERRLPGSLARAPAPGLAEQLATLGKYYEQIAKVRESPAYRALSPEDHARAEMIIAMASVRPNRDYYADKLALLFSTETAPPETVAEHNVEQLDAAVAESAARLEDPVAQVDFDREERLMRDPGRKFSTLPGIGASYRVDRSDPTNVMVQMKVHLKGAEADVAKTKAIEDDIEKAASTEGYTFDIEFVAHSGSDVFEADVDPSRWADSGNWIGSADTLAHEAHHRLTLDDRYDYIESHAGNADMKISDRLYWFLEQMKKPDDPRGAASIMGGGPKPLHDDVCKVVQTPDPEACVDTRTRALDP